MKLKGSETNENFLFLRDTHRAGQPKAGNRNMPVRHQLATIDSEQARPRYHQARSWGRLQMIGIRTRTTTVNDTDRRGSPSNWGRSATRAKSPASVNTESQAGTVLSGGTPLPNTILPTWNNNPRGHATAAHQTSKSEGCEVNHFSVMTHFLREN